jgi:hypothetical protein
MYASASRSELHWQFSIFHISAFEHLLYFALLILPTVLINLVLAAFFLVLILLSRHCHMNSMYSRIADNALFLIFPVLRLRAIYCWPHLARPNFSIVSYLFVSYNVFFRQALIRPKKFR